LAAVEGGFVWAELGAATAGAGDGTEAAGAAGGPLFSTTVVEGGGTGVVAAGVLTPTASEGPAFLLSSLPNKPEASEGDTMASPLLVERLLGGNPPNKS